MTAVLERDGISGPAYVTEPYEVSWAAEARWFVRVLDWPAGIDRIETTVQVSPDGLNWCELEGSGTAISTTGVTTFVSREFGGWLRLAATVVGDHPATGVPALIYLALKG